jgi:hypothetical protein
MKDDDGRMQLGLNQILAGVQGRDAAIVDATEQNHSVLFVVVDAGADQVFVVDVGDEGAQGFGGLVAEIVSGAVFQAQDYGGLSTWKRILSISTILLEQNFIGKIGSKSVGFWELSREQPRLLS